MKKYILLGKIFPAFPKLIIYPSSPSVNPLKQGSLGFEIRKSIITAELSIDHIESKGTAIKSVEQTIQGLVDAYSFVHGDNFYVRIEVIKENNQADFYSDPTFQELLPDIDNKDLPKIETLMSVSIENMSFRFALSNFSKAKHYTAYTGLYIYLAIENVKKYFFPEDLKNESKEWVELRAKLSLTREEIEFAKTFADHVRHGKYQDVQGKDNVKILKLGAEIVYKFFKYLLDLKK